MRLDPDGVLVLSRRNLETLLAKLDQPGSTRTIVGGTDALGRAVRSEENDEHYRDRLPGEVHPETLRLMEQSYE